MYWGKGLWTQNSAPSPNNNMPGFFGEAMTTENMTLLYIEWGHGSIEVHVMVWLTTTLQSFRLRFCTSSTPESLLGDVMNRTWDFTHAKYVYYLVSYSSSTKLNQNTETKAEISLLYVWAYSLSNRNKTCTKPSTEESETQQGACEHNTHICFFTPPTYLTSL